MSRATEDIIAPAVLLIASKNADGICTFDQAYAQIPKIVQLSAEDWEGSIPRNGEPMWYQIVRNIKSHSKDDGNFIKLGLLEHVPDTGYRITDAGRAYLKKKGL